MTDQERDKALFQEAKNKWQAFMGSGLGGFRQQVVDRLIALGLVKHQDHLADHEIMDILSSDLYESK